MRIRFVIRAGALLLLAAFNAQALADTVSMQPGMDRMGGDYKGFPLRDADPQLCRIACEQDNVCKAYTYVRPGLKGPQAMCFLKNAVVAASPSDCCTSGEKTVARGGRPPPIPQPAPMPTPPPPPAPTQQPTVTPPNTVIAKSELNQVEIQWTWYSQGCFPSGAGQPPQPCMFVKDIEGFRVYGSNGALKKDLTGPAIRSTLAGFEPGMCYVVTAYKGSLESAKSQPGCVDAAPVSQTTTGIAVPGNLRLVDSISGCIAVTHNPSDYCKSLFAKNSRVLTWDYSEANISGFRLYRDVNGSPALQQTASVQPWRYFVIPANSGVLISDACLSVRAFQAGLESAASNQLCLQPVFVQSLPSIKLHPVSGIVLHGEDSRGYWNDSCPFDETRFSQRSTQPFSGAFPLGYSRENNEEFHETVMSTAPLCDHWSSKWNEGSVMFSLEGLPADIGSATLRFTSTSHCAVAIHAYYDTLVDNAAGHSGDPKAWFSWLKNEEVKGEVNNAPGESSTSALGVTALVKKALSSGRNKLGFVVSTDKALKDDDYECSGAYRDFTLSIQPLQPN